MKKILFISLIITTFTVKAQLNRQFILNIPRPANEKFWTLGNIKTVHKSADYAILTWYAYSTLKASYGMYVYDNNKNTGTHYLKVGLIEFAAGIAIDVPLTIWWKKWSKRNISIPSQLDLMN